MATRTTAAKRAISLYEEGETVTDVTAVMPPTTVSTPDTADLAPRRVQMEQLIVFRVVDDASYIEANQHFTAVSDYLEAVTSKFSEAAAAANKAHKFITGLRGLFLKPAEAAKQNLTAQLLAYRQKKEAERRAEELRLQREEEERQRKIREEQERIAAEQRAAQQAELMPWEEPEEIPAPPPPPPVEVPVVRLPSTVPLVGGGPSARKKPWAAAFKQSDKETNTPDGRIAFLLWVVANPTDRLGYIDWESVASKLRPKAAELQGEMENVIPGTYAFQGETLAR